LFELIAHRYETGSLIITSNQPFSEWDKIFTDSTMTVAAIDRVVHHSVILEVEADSYRKRQAISQNIISSPAPNTKNDPTLAKETQQMALGT
jgi:DNA replication protein DnaC